MTVVTFPEVFDERGLSATIWKNFPAHQILNLKNASVGHGVKLDAANPPFSAADTGTYTDGGSGVRTFTDNTAIIRGLTWAEGGPGVRFFTSADNDAAETQWCGGGEPFIISDTAADKLELVYEVQFRLSTITTNELGLFIGLAGTASMDGDFLEDDVPTADSPGVDDLDMLGIFMNHADTSGLDIMYQLSGSDAVTHEAEWKTLETDTWYIFGMRYKPTDEKVDFYWGTGDRSTTDVAVDDNPIDADDIASAGSDKFPDGQGLAPVIAIKGGTGNDEYLDVRTMACAQMAKDAD